MLALRPEASPSSATARNARGRWDDRPERKSLTVEIVADAFAGQNRVARQRLVNRYALADLLVEKVHALAIQAKTPVSNEKPERPAAGCS